VIQGADCFDQETYLFTAACSELSTEIRNNRRLEEEQLRQQRTHLQHEVDILTQSLNQEVLTLNDNVRGLFNDRKMAVSEEQKVVQSAVSFLSWIRGMGMWLADSIPGPANQLQDQHRT
jgi:hypothetical protein